VEVLVGGWLIFMCTIESCPKSTRSRFTSCVRIGLGQVI
jgi:hypothetical protein